MQSINIQLPMALRSISRLWDCVGKEASAVGEAQQQPHGVWGNGIFAAPGAGRIVLHSEGPEAVRMALTRM